MDRTDMILLKLSKTFPFRVMEWILAGLMVSWALALGNHTPTEMQNPVYAGLLRIAPQEDWVFFAFWIGALRLIALAINGAWRPSPHIRAAGAFVSCLFWLQISLGLALTEVATTSIAVYPWLLIADVYNVFRASSDARVSDDRARGSSVKGRRQSASAGTD